MVVVVAPILGPVLGGWITDNLSWPWLFYINIPIGLLAAITTWTLLKRRESQRVHAPVDVLGIILLFLGVGALQYMLDKGNELDWFSSPAIVVAASIAVGGLVYLVAWELTEQHPVIDVHLFQIRNFLVGAFVAFGSFFCFFGATVLFPLWLETTVGYTATWAGYAMAPFGFLMLVLVPIVGRLMPRLNIRLCMSFGFAVIGTSMWLMTQLSEHSSFWQLVWPRLLLGAGMPFFFLPLNSILMSRITPDHFASASGLFGFLRTIAGSVSTAVSVWLWNRRQDYHHTVLVEHITSTAPGWNAVHDRLAGAGLTEPTIHAVTAQAIAQQASTLACNDAYLLYAALLLGMIPVVWLARGPFRIGGGGMH